MINKPQIESIYFKLKSMLCLCLRKYLCKYVKSTISLLWEMVSAISTIRYLLFGQYIIHVFAALHETTHRGSRQAPCHQRSLITSILYQLYKYQQHQLNYPCCEKDRKIVVQHCLKQMSVMMNWLQQNTESSTFALYTKLMAELFINTRTCTFRSHLIRSDIPIYCIVRFHSL